MTEMVERVARAIDEVANPDHDGGFTPSNLQAMARAAILAMRSPTMAMARAACVRAAQEQVRPVAIHLADTYECWYAMIDAALGGEG